MTGKGVSQAVVLFDGECNVCDGFVNFLIDRDPEARLLYASQQSAVGTQLMSERGIVTDLETMVMIQGKNIYTHSTAAIRTMALLGGLWKLMLIFLLVPRFIRDFCYSTFAKYRYRLFGKKGEESACRRLTPDVKRRFLQYNQEVREQILSPTPGVSSATTKDD